jgi:tetratricopeptide (TPR) repeat protein
MAAKLAEKHGAAKLDSYAASGGLAFVDDYLTVAKTDSTIAKDLAVNAEFNTVLAELADDWRKTNTDYVRKLSVTSMTDFDRVGTQLRETFKGASLYPNVVDQLFAVTRQSVISGDNARALKAARLAFDLYPESNGANFAYGIALVLSGDSAGGQERLRKSASLNPTGLASAAGLNNIAYQLTGTGTVDRALAVLETAIALYPKEANLYDSLGEFQLRKGEKLKALQSYQKALEIDPNYPNAAAAREVVKKLTEEVTQKQ